MKPLKTPLKERDVRQLQAGDEVTITAVIYTARDMAHKRLCAALEQGHELPISLEGALIYFVGPTPARAGAVIGAAGPTTSICGLPHASWFHLPGSWYCGLVAWFDSAGSRHARGRDNRLGWLFLPLGTDA